MLYGLIGLGAYLVIYQPEAFAALGKLIGGLGLGFADGIGTIIGSWT